MFNWKKLPTTSIYIFAFYSDLETRQFLLSDLIGIFPIQSADAYKPALYGIHQHKEYPGTG